MITELLSQVQAFLQTTILNTITSTQVISLALILLVSWALRFFLMRLLKRLETFLPKAVWSHHLMVILRRAASPLTTLLLTQVTAMTLVILGQETDLFHSVIILIQFWLLYEVAAGIVDISLSQDKAQFINRKIILPLALILAILNIFGLTERILSWGIYIESINLSLTIGSVLFASAFFIIFLVLARWIGNVLSTSLLPQAGVEAGLANTISKFAVYIVLTIGLLVSLGTIGIDLTALTVILGGLSVGLAFGLQDIVNNFVSGFVILLERSIEPGDVVSVTNNVGIVKRVGVRSTIIKTRDNVELIVPNSYFLTEIVTNMTHAEDLIRIKISVGVSYNASPREVEQALLEVAAQHPKVLTEPSPSVQFREFGDSSLNFTLFVWTNKAIEAPLLTSDIRFGVWDALAARNIEIPFPQRDIHIRSAEPLLGSPQTRPD